MVLSYPLSNWGLLAVVMASLMEMVKRALPMNQRLMLAIVCGLAVVCGAKADDAQQYTGEARGIAKQFFGTLKGELQGVMKQGGPVAAIGFCNIRAPQINSQVSYDVGWDVARTSLKPRNPKNAPDAWEMAVLERFEARKAAGEDVKSMEHAEIVESDGQKVFRYMKAIPTAELCLTCHGSEIPAEVATHLDQLYPKDTARGFKEGDIRGAFTLSKNL
jgi:hypothetical protein